MSADGRYVAFDSAASNLDPDATGANSQVFVRDLQANTTTLASRTGGSAGAEGNDMSAQATISADGRQVAFTSAATNLHPDDTDATRDIFVRDVQASTTTLASRGTGAGGAKGNGDSAEGGIAADGRHVVFRSSATNLHPDDADATSDIFVRDVQAGTTTLVSRATGVAGVKGNGVSLNRRAISADGRYVIFESGASNLDPDDTGTTTDVFARDLQAGTTTLVSRAGGTAGAKGNSQSYEPVVSGDGRFAAFTSGSTNLHPDDTSAGEDIFVRDVLGAPPAPAPAPAPPAAPPTPPAAAKLAPLACAANKLILTDVFPKAGRTRLVGVAPPAAAGKVVTIVSAWNGKTVARPKVRADLTFTASAPLPPRRLRSSNQARYGARFGKQRSLILKFARRMYTTAISTKGRTVTFAGKITPPLAKPVQKVVIRASASCSTIGRGKIVATVRPSPRGAFKARIVLPAGSSVIFLRAQTRVRKNTRSRKTAATFTLIRGVRADR